MNNGQITILIVEDNPVNLELVVDLLSVAGFHVLSVNNAERALELASSEKPHLVLMDISLPGTDGLKATVALKAQRCTAHIPVVALTAHAMAGDAEQALEAGCCVHLAKPINTRTFVTEISTILQRFHPNP